MNFFSLKTRPKLENSFSITENKLPADLSNLGMTVLKVERHVFEQCNSNIETNSKLEF